MMNGYLNLLNPQSVALNQLADYLLEDGQLMQEWLAGQAEGLPAIQRLINNWRLANRLLVPEMMALALSVTISYPLHVVMLRKMAETVEQEVTSGFNLDIISLTWRIYQNEGITAFLSGLTPYLLYQVGSLWLAGNLAFLAHIRTRFNNQAWQNMHNAAPVYGYLSQFLLHPLEVVSTVMAVSGSGMKVAEHVQGGWVEYLSRLASSHQLFRGFFYFLRRYSYPQENISKSDNL